ncbi:hypothetical protein KHQ81_06315 [Mycoplasmatota bacterium]|nr:hypothetical protein KHQ81_06315 [Mycoplasmatota bacterium]
MMKIFTILPSSIIGANQYTFSVNNPVTVNANTEIIAQVYGTSVAGLFFNSDDNIGSSVSSATQVDNLVTVSNFVGVSDELFKFGNKLLRNTADDIIANAEKSLLLISVNGVDDYSVYSFSRGSMLEALLTLSNKQIRYANGFKTASKVAKGVGIGLLAVDIGISVHNNYNIPKLSNGQKLGYTVVDAGISGVLFGFAWLGPVGLGVSIATYIIIENTDVDDRLKEALFG